MEGTQSVRNILVISTCSLWKGKDPCGVPPASDFWTSPSVQRRPLFVWTISLCFCGKPVWIDWKQLTCNGQVYLFHKALSIAPTIALCGDTSICRPLWSTLMPRFSKPPNIDTNHRVTHKFWFQPTAKQTDVEEQRLGLRSSSQFWPQTMGRIRKRWGSYYGWSGGFRFSCVSPVAEEFLNMLINVHSSPHNIN